MLDAIAAFFEQQTRAGRKDRHTVSVATAALLVEVMRMDGTMGDAERATILRAVRERFGLADADSAQLIALAGTASREATDYYQFTSLLNQRLTHEEKVDVIARMWEVAYADGAVDLYEEHLIRKIADLLYVSHGDYIAGKLRARDAHASVTDRTSGRGVP